MALLGRISSHAATVLLTLCYLAFGVFDPSQAQRLWWPFGVAVLVLAGVNLILERRG